MTLVDLGNSANSAYLSNLQKVDQSFTAKDLGRDVFCAPIRRGIVKGLGGAHHYRLR